MSDLRVLVSAAALAAGVAAAVSAATLRFLPEAPPGIATVRLAELTADYALRMADTGASAEAAAARTRTWAAALEAALRDAAERHRVVVLPAGAVAAGAVDLTPEIEAALAGAMARSAAPDPERGR